MFEFSIFDRDESEENEWKAYLEDLCERNIWLKKNKREIRINDMTNEHLENAINLIKNGSPIRGLAQKYLPKLETELKGRKDLI